MKVMEYISENPNNRVEVFDGVGRVILTHCLYRRCGMLALFRKIKSRRNRDRIFKAFVKLDFKKAERERIKKHMIERYGYAADSYIHIIH